MRVIHVCMYIFVCQLIYTSDKWRYRRRKLRTERDRTLSLSLFLSHTPTHTRSHEHTHTHTHRCKYRRRTESMKYRKCLRVYTQVTPGRASAAISRSPSPGVNRLSSPVVCSRSSQNSSVNFHRHSPCSKYFLSSPASKLYNVLGACRFDEWLYHHHHIDRAALPDPNLL